jgi:UDP-4-amino-4,6-dideoxy-L-N-acetyl-beta-L-altrosamine transaminase
MSFESLRIPFAKHSIDQQDRQAVEDTLKSNWITRGPKVNLFEKALAKEVKAKDVICFSSASTALWAACQAIKLSSFDEVYAPTNTFIASASCAMNQRALLYLLDIDPLTGSLNFDLLETKLSHPLYRGRRVIIPVHFAGMALDMKRLSSLVSHRDIIIEDAAHALGSYYPSGEPVGCCDYSDMTVFSFHASKNITSGEGGAVSTNDELLASKLRLLRDSGIDRSSAEPGYYEVSHLSCNYHLNEMQAALGLSQLTKLRQMGAKRQSLIQEYRQNLNPSIQLLTSLESSATYHHLCTALINFDHLCFKRLALMSHLKSKGIGSQVHYVPLYKHPIIKNYKGWINRDLNNFSGTEQYYSQTLSLPLFHDLQNEQILEITQVLHQALKLS